ncbi:hypothetical protein H5410_062570 [Solanum commersonii]|uniref:Uncharacterized protein n=1 Tax=Solanum commersonii TaxID=4109 RepID=A0A9J5WBX4_SOLCO|nr:hypothetical protein H5410_062570 [Solanum commersonii]
MTHNQKIKLDSIRKERNRLKKILKEIGGIEIHKPNIGSNLNDMTFCENSNLEDKVSNLELEHHIECSNLKNLDDNKLKWELKGLVLASEIAFGLRIVCSSSLSCSPPSSSATALEGATCYSSSDSSATIFLFDFEGPVGFFSIFFEFEGPAVGYSVDLKKQ